MGADEIFSRGAIANADTCAYQAARAYTWKQYPEAFDYYNKAAHCLLAYANSDDNIKTTVAFYKQEAKYAFEKSKVPKTKEERRDSVIDTAVDILFFVGGSLFVLYVLGFSCVFFTRQDLLPLFSIHFLGLCLFVTFFYVLLTCFLMTVY